MTDLFEKLMNAGINHLKRSPVLQSTVATADATMDRINAFLKPDPVALDALVASLSQGADELILATERSEGLAYVGGQLTALAPAPQTSSFALVLKLYFKAEGDKVILKESRKELDVELLTAESLQELVAKQSIAFEVDPPEQVG